jgi:hypothetical protein
MPEKVLNGDWSEYDSRKQKEGRDSAHVSCMDEWEVELIAAATVNAYPQYALTAVRSAIRQICAGTAIRHRDDFVSAVMRRLRLLY